MNYTGRIEFTPPTEDLQDPDIVYYSGLLINDSAPSASQIDPIVRFTETRDKPLVSDASKYHFSIIRFNLNGSGKDLPIFIPTIATGANNPTKDVNLTIYKVSLTCSVKYLINGTLRTSPVFTETTAIQYRPETLDPRLAPVPPSSTVDEGQDIAPNRYYWVYTYANWVDQINATLGKCLGGIQAQFKTWYQAFPSAGVAPTLITSPPKVTYNPANGLFSIYADTYGFGGESRQSQYIDPNADESFELYFNAPMFMLLANFENEYYGDVDLTNKIVTGNVSDLYQNIISIGSPLDKSFWVMTQDYESTSSLWSPVDSIVFSSGLLPIVVENTSDPIRTNSNNLGTTQTSKGFDPVITDVALEQMSASSYRGFFQYVPTGEYRLSSMLRSKTPIVTFDVTCFWKSRLNGKLYPLQMPVGSSASIKIMLRRRGISDYPHPRRENGVDV
jgi:hypothetical protein